LAHLFSIAQRLASNERGAEHARVIAIRLLGHDRRNDESTAHLLALVDAHGDDAQHPGSAIVRAAVESLLQLRSTNVVQELIDRWPKLAPPLRSTIIQTLLSRAEGVALLVRALEQNDILRADLSASQVSFLHSYRERWLRERAGRVLGAFTASSRAEAIARYESSLNLNGGRARGQEIFLDRCASCHHLVGKGHVLGPDLASIRSNGKEKLLVGVIDPNREVAPQFTGYVLETSDGETHTGILLDQSDASVTLRQAGGIEATMPRARVARLTSQGQSIMPEGLEVGLTPQDMADLIEFVMTAEAPAK
jgi:putative heme-binding domain-containing protein